MFVVHRKLYKIRVPVDWEGFRRDHHRTRPAHGWHTGARGRAHQLQSLWLSSRAFSEEETSALEAGRGNIRRGATAGHRTATNKALYQQHRESTRTLITAVLNFPTSSFKIEKYYGFCSYNCHFTDQVTKAKPNKKNPKPQRYGEEYASTQSRAFSAWYLVNIFYFPSYLIQINSLS